MDRPLQIGDRCKVRWRGDGNNLIDAVVIERRVVGHRKRRRAAKGSSLPDLEKLAGNEVEYYVHYDGHDRYVFSEESDVFAGSNSSLTFRDSGD